MLSLNLVADNEIAAPLTEEGVEEYIVRVIMINQYTLKKELELFGEKVEEATIKELNQIHDMDTYTHIIDDLSNR